MIFPPFFDFLYYINAVLNDAFLETIYYCIVDAPELYDSNNINEIYNNAFFPLKNFWEHIVLIFNHYYGYPDCYTKEEMKKNQILIYLLFLKM